VDEKQELKDKLRNLNNDELMSLTNAVVQDEIDRSISKHQDIKDMSKFYFWSGFGVDYCVDATLTNSQRSSGFDPSLAKKTNMVSQKQAESKYSKPGKAFEYRENKEVSKNPQKQTFGGWDVPEDDYDASDNSDLHYNDNLKNANDWDYEPTNKPVPKTQVEISSPKLNKHITSGIKYGYVDESDESQSDKDSEEDYDWGSLDQ
jgi:hypothetical protein